MSGKLAFLEAFINSRVQAPFDRVTVAGLYEAACKCKGDRNGGFFKRRWRVTFVPLEHTADAVERLRASFERTLVLASPGCVMCA